VIDAENEEAKSRKFVSKEKGRKWRREMLTVIRDSSRYPAVMTFQK
jgi:hypothetical protein